MINAGIIASSRRRSGGGVADFGALVRNSVSQGFTTTPYDAAWNTEVYDLNAWHDNATNNSRLTVISGVSLVRVSSNVSSAANDRIDHMKNGATFKGNGRADSDGLLNIVSAPIAVTAGDYFTTLVTHSSGLSSVTGDERSWMSIEILSASLKYALVHKSANQSISASTNTALAFGSEVADTNSFHDTVTNNSRLTVPSGVTLVRVSGQARGEAAGQFFVFFTKNGATARGLPAKDTDTAGNDHVNIISAPIVVTTGDYFELNVFAANATTVSAIDDVWFAIEEVSASLKYALVNKSSGTQSFTGAAAAVAVTWDAEVADANGMHDNVTNNTRLTVPSGCTRARPSFGVKTSNVANAMTATVRKNGSDYHGMPTYRCDTAGTDNLSGMGAWVDVTPGDYFEVFFSCATTCTLGTEDENWFCLECQ